MAPVTHDRFIMISKKNKYYIEYLLFRTIEKAVHLLPNASLDRLATAIAFLSFRVLKYRRAVTLENLAHAFPEKPATERERIAYASYRHFALLMLEFMKISAWDLATLESRISFEPPSVEQALTHRFRGKGFVLVSGHFGSWEMIAAYLAARHFPGGMGIIKRQRNFYIDRYVKEMRQRWKLKLTYSRGGIADCLKNIQQQRFGGLLCDQDAGRRGVFVPFMGRPAATPVGAAVLHLRSGTPLVFGCAIRDGLFKYRGVFKVIEFEGDHAVTQENIVRVTTAFTRELEKVVRLYPEQYLWLHRRWKTRPEGEMSQMP